MQQKICFKKFYPEIGLHIKNKTDTHRNKTELIKTELSFQETGILERLWFVMTDVRHIHHISEARSKCTWWHHVHKHQHWCDWIFDWYPSHTTRPNPTPQNCFVVSRRRRSSGLGISDDVSCAFNFLWVYDLYRAFDCTTHDTISPPQGQWYIYGRCV